MEPVEKTPLSTDQKMKNLTAIAILLGGLFLGSLLVDFVQLATGSGFSAHIVKKYDVLESKGKTWVAFADPKVKVNVITEKDCVNCNPSEPLVWLRRALPTLEATEVERSSEIGKTLIDRFQITSIPAFVFSKEVTETDFYGQAESLFQNQGSWYYFDMTKIGLPAGKYLQQPEIREGDIVVGSPDAPAKIFVYSDFQCTFCQTFHTDLNRLMKEYGDKVTLVYRHLPLSIHPQAGNAALAAECANEQGKFSIYADNLFAKQEEWGGTTGTQKFKDYAWRLGLNGRTFSQCLDTQKYKDKIVVDVADADTYAISGTPATFVNDEFYGGALNEEELKAAIDKALAQ